MLLILLYGDRASESDTAAAALYTKFKERGINANLILSDLAIAGKYGYYYEDFLEGMEEIVFSRNEDVDVCIMNVPYIYYPSLCSEEAYAVKQKDNILCSGDYVDLRRRILDLLEEEGHDILEYTLLEDKDNTRTKTDLRHDEIMNLRNDRISKKDYEDYYFCCKAAEELGLPHSIHNIPEIKSNPIKWNEIFEEAVCILRGWDSFGI